MSDRVRIEHRLTIGRIVRYRLTDGEKQILGNCDHLPAVIVRHSYPSTTVNIRILPDNQVNERWKANVPHGDAIGQWSWPGEYQQ